MGLEQKLGNMGVVTTTLEQAVAWSRNYAMWPILFGLACCAIEMMAAEASDYDMSRFGMRFQTPVGSSMETTERVLDEIERWRDGLTLDATGQGAAIRVLGKVTGRPDAETAGRYWLAATEGDQTTGSAFCILATAAPGSRAGQLLAGMAFQRLQLWAGGVGLAIQVLPRE